MDSEPEETKDWFSHYIKEYQFHVDDKGWELATAKAKSGKKRNNRKINELETEFKALKEHKDVIEELSEMKEEVP